MQEFMQWVIHGSDGLSRIGQCKDTSTLAYMQELVCDYPDNVLTDI